MTRYLTQWRSGRAPKARPRGAFTLIELLVAIGIIVVLLAILLPVISTARRAARNTVCLKNLRQLEAALLLYMQDNNGQTMAYSENKDVYWHHLIAPYLGDPQYVTSADVGEHPSMAVLFCPEATDVSTLITGTGSATTAWHFSLKDAGGGSGSYGLNCWLLPNDSVYRNPTSSPPPLPPGYLIASRYYPDWASAAPALNIPVFADAIWPGSWPDRDDIKPSAATVPPSDLQSGDANSKIGEFMGRFCINRHNMAINVVFADGSARRVPLAELWQLDWHRGWVAPVPPVTIP